LYYKQQVPGDYCLLCFRIPELVHSNVFRIADEFYQDSTVSKGLGPLLLGAMDPCITVEDMEVQDVRGNAKESLVWSDPTI